MIAMEFLNDNNELYKQEWFKQAKELKIAIEDIIKAE